MQFNFPYCHILRNYKKKTKKGSYFSLTEIKETLSSHEISMYLSCLLATCRRHHYNDHQKRAKERRKPGTSMVPRDIRTD